MCVRIPLTVDFQAPHKKMLMDELWKSAFLPGSPGDLPGGGSSDHTLSLYRPTESLHKLCLKSFVSHLTCIAVPAGMLDVSGILKEP